TLIPEAIRISYSSLVGINSTIRFGFFSIFSFKTFLSVDYPPSVQMTRILGQECNKKKLNQRQERCLGSI
ncbi:MAG: hypothetical protein VZT48_00500, partial [Bulleidia sp.]|nr:hypothetical protein [Bulleidia sp.]